MRKNEVKQIAEWEDEIYARLRKRGCSDDDIRYSLIERNCFNARALEIQVREMRRQERISGEMERIRKELQADGLSEHEINSYLEGYSDSCDIAYDARHEQDFDTKIVNTNDINKIMSFLAEITLLVGDLKYDDWLDNVRELAHLRWLEDNDDAELVEFKPGEDVLIV